MFVCVGAHVHVCPSLPLPLPYMLPCLLPYVQVLVALMGCIPVTITDGVYQPFEPELPWADFSVPVAEDDIPRLHEVLEALPPEQVEQMQVGRAGEGRGGEGREGRGREGRGILCLPPSTAPSPQISIAPCPYGNLPALLYHTRLTPPLTFPLLSLSHGPLAHPATPHAAPQSRLHCAAQHMFYSSSLGAIIGEDGRYGEAAGRAGGRRAVGAGSRRDTGRHASG